ncbi:Pam17 [Kluyveromyces lactis]|nr:Pam17 [Kluyveromyces lactis]
MLRLGINLQNRLLVGLNGQSLLKRAITRNAVAIRMNSTNSGKTVSHEMTWPEFFKLRKKERVFNTASSVATAIVFVNGSWFYFSTLEIDPTQTIFGFDPLMAITAGMITCAAVGWLLGPIVGTALFKATSGPKLLQFQEKQLSFLAKIQKNRVNPQSQSFSNPVPDYYGEKINSIPQYRQWLRDCHSYKRKASEFL